MSEFIKLSSVAEIIMGQSPDSSSCNTNTLGIPFLQGCGEFGDKHPNIIKFCTKPTKIAPKNSLLISVRAPVGDINIADREVCIGRGLGAIVAKKTDRQFLYFAILQFKHQLKRISQGSTFEAINSADLANFWLPFVPLPQQRKIARILSTCDAVIEKTEAAIAKYRALKQGLMHDLFTRGIDLNTGRLRPKYEEAPELYKESELGWVPKEWEVRKLGNLTSKIGSGITPTGGSEVYQKAGVLFIRSQNVLNGKLSLENAAYISNKVDDRMVGSKVEPYDVLLNITGASIGRCAYFPKSLITANVNQHVCIIRFPKASKIQAVFTAQFLNSHFGQRQILRYNAGGNREGLNFQQLGSFDFPFVSPKELAAISRKIEKVDSKIIHEESALSKYRQLKAGLMQDLLSGKVEVSVGEELENN